MGCFWTIFILVLDIILLVRVGARLGMSNLLPVILATGILGFLTIRTGGFRLRPSREAPAMRLLDNALIYLAGLLLLFPGLVSDVLGLLLLVPPIRRKLRDSFKDTVAGRRLGEGQGGRFTFWWSGGRTDRTERTNWDGGEVIRGDPRGDAGRSLEEYPDVSQAKDVDFSETDPPDRED